MRKPARASRRASAKKAVRNAESGAPRKKAAAAKKAAARKSASSGRSGHAAPIAATKASASEILEALHVSEAHRKIGLAALRSARTIDRH